MITIGSNKAGSIFWGDQKIGKIFNGNNTVFEGGIKGEWVAKVWDYSGNKDFVLSGNSVWTDGTYYYCDSQFGDNPQFMFNPSTQRWEDKIWYDSNNNVVKIRGTQNYYENDDIFNYYYNGSSYVLLKLNKSTGKWESQGTSSGATTQSGGYIWTTDIIPNKYFMSNGSSQHTSTNKRSWSSFSSQTFSPTTVKNNLRGSNIWKYNGETLLSAGSVQYKLYNITQTYPLKWITVRWTGLTNFTGQNIWEYKGITYYSNGANQYYLSGSYTWSPKTWTGYTSVDGGWIFEMYGKMYFAYKGSASGDQLSYELK